MSRSPKACSVCGVKRDPADMLVVRWHIWVCGRDCALAAERRWQAEYGVQREALSNG